MNLDKEKIRNLAHKYGFYFNEDQKAYWMKGRSESNGKNVELCVNPNSIRFCAWKGFDFGKTWWQIKEGAGVTVSDIDNIVRFLSTNESKDVEINETFPNLNIEKWYDKRSTGNFVFSNNKKWSELSTFEKAVKIGFLIFWLVVVIWGLI